MDPSPTEHRSKTLEDELLTFIEQHNRWIWAAIALMAVVVVLALNRG